MLSWIEDITNFIFIEDSPEKADIIFVPGNGHAGPSELAAKLWHEGYAPLILPSGRYSIARGEFSGQISGSREYIGRFETEWAFMHHILTENDVPESAILHEDEATYTYQNAIYSRRLTDQKAIHVHTAIVCCVPVHARRAKMYYQTLYPDAKILICPCPGMITTRDHWIHEPHSIDLVLGEMERCGTQFHDILKEILL